MSSSGAAPCDWIYVYAWNGAFADFTFGASHECDQSEYSSGGSDFDCDSYIADHIVISDADLLALANVAIYSDYECHKVEWEFHTSIDKDAPVSDGDTILVAHAEPVSFYAFIDETNTPSDFLAKVNIDSLLVGCLPEYMVTHTIATTTDAFDVQLVTIPETENADYHSNDVKKFEVSLVAGKSPTSDVTITFSMTRQDDSSLVKQVTVTF